MNTSISSYDYRHTRFIRDKKNSQEDKNMEKKYMYPVVIIFIIVFFSSIFRSLNQFQDFKLGVYTTADGWSSLNLEEDLTFSLNRSLSTSYDPEGDYLVKGDKLILRVNGNDDEIIQFRISDNVLIFESGKLAENLIEKGTRFNYDVQMEQLYDYRQMISYGKLLYFDTGKSKEQLSQEWVEIGMIEEVCLSIEPMKIEEDYYIANHFSVGTILFGNNRDVDVIYVKYNDRFIEYILQER